jgi:hypothetical protein
MMKQRAQARTRIVSLNHLNAQPSMKGGSQ